MRVLRLARIAAEAEGILLGQQAGRLARRLVLGLLAALFGVTFLGFAHAAAWLALTDRYSSLMISMIIGGVDLLLTLCLTLFAMRGKPNVLEQAALLRRDSALEAMGQAPLAAPLLLTVVEEALRSWRKRK